MATRATDSLEPWLILYHANGLGTAAIHRLLAALPDPAEILAAGPSEWQRLGLPRQAVEALRRPPQPAIERDLAWREQPGNHILVCTDPHYPPLLRELPDAPPLLYVHGEPGLLSAPQLAIVGSRNPTPAGRQTATEFARHLAAAGLVITSGLAAGIDAAGHQGALDAGGRTIAVTGTGLDRVYPAGNRALARRIAAQGALVSEFPIGTPPLAENFPRRNRILSGLSLGTLVVEAALRSGSLITARCATEQGREVFAIPGSIHNTLARGCHALIRQGAKLVETATDILEELGPLAAAAHVATAGTGGGGGEPEADWDPAPEYLQLLDSMGFETIPIDNLVHRSGLTPAEVSSMLLQLELAGYVASSPGGRYIRLK